MEEQFIHRGIACMVSRSQSGGWKWEVNPPNAIKGLMHASGEAPKKTAAIIAARAAVDKQTSVYMR
jgi:hypothetical protein